MKSKYKRGKPRTKILLILPRYELALEEKDFNFGFGYLCFVLMASGYDVEVLNTQPLFIDRAGIERKINEAECDIIGLGGLSVAFNHIEWMIDYIRKARPEIPIILGGGIITAVPLLIYNHLKPDFGVIGEGENTIVELIKCLTKKRNPKEIMGIIFHDGKNVIRTQSCEPIRNLDALPYPAWDDLHVESIIENASL